jgi:hypothetical protein
VTAAPVNQRRSQRLFIQVPVVVEGQLADKSKFSEACKTIVVNAHGALVGLRAPVPQGQTITLRNVRTNETQESTVKLVSPGDPGMFNVAIEFIKPSPKFWHITFPPEDWSSRYLDEKKNP